jgi:hypothetical protein
MGSVPFAVTPSFFGWLIFDTLPSDGLGNLIIFHRERPFGKKKLLVFYDFKAGFWRQLITFNNLLKIIYL